MKPTRIQLSRRPGFSLAAVSMALNGLPAVKVDRTTKWGNPFVVGKDGTAARCVELFRFMLAGYICISKGDPETYCAYHEHARAHRDELRGKNLACWCKPGTPCHADVLLELANK